MPKPPIDPDSFDKVNFVIDAWTTGCDAPWYIYVETMKPALVTAFITLITFGWDDVLRGYFRPRGLYKRRTAKRAGKWTRRLPSFPEVGDALGKKLPGAYEVKGTKWSVLGKTLWRIDGAMEQIRFYWLVVAIVEDFAFDWTSLLFESYWCLPDPAGRFSYQEPGWTQFNDDVWFRVVFSVEDYEHGPPVWVYYQGATGDNPAVVTAAMTIKKHPSFPAPSTFAVRVQNVGTSEVYGQTGPYDLATSGDGTYPCSGTVPPNTAFEVRIHMTGAEYALYGHSVVIGVEVLP